MKPFYAHSTESEDKSSWQPLDDHLQNVSDLAGNFANSFNAGKWGEFAGMLHDAGKASKAFQKRLEGAQIKVDHKTFGARIAVAQTGPLGMLLAYVISGHHGGLTDGGEQTGQLHHRLKHGKIPDDTELQTEIRWENELQLPFKLEKDFAGFSLSFFTRMLFSCLVDADFLDTEAFCDPYRAKYRHDSLSSELLGDLKGNFDRHLEKITHKAADTPVNTIRQAVLGQCRGKAQLPPGFFSLTVPTGGGKTFSSLAFALDHAVKNRLGRIVYAIPFTSIIEQNANVFKDALGVEHVLEHHCNYKELENLEDGSYELRRRLAIENWSSPLIVTTNVQFFESLFSSKPSRCRKLHNIAGSIIILDEAQAIPTEYLEPCVRALSELVYHYKCTVVLCTATQPALDDEGSLRNKLSGVTEIIDDPQYLFEKLSRTTVDFAGKFTDEELVERLAGEENVLCILPTKRQAREIFEGARGGSGVYHLSTNMYPEHRRMVLDEIRFCLTNKKPCKVISTSLVEAGVDLDFPVVYRAMAGLDSIAQAAGRCNREGKMKDKGKVVVFETEKLPSMPWLKRCMTRATETLRTLPDEDPIGVKAMRRYFQLLFDVEDLDKKKIVQRLNTLTRDLYFPFKEIGEEFRFIEDDTVGVIIPLEPEVEKMVNELRYSGCQRTTSRKLQQYSVSVREKDVHELNNAGALEIVDGVFPVLRNTFAYDQEVGLCVDRGAVWSSTDLIV